MAQPIEKCSAKAIAIEVVVHPDPVHSDISAEGDFGTISPPIEHGHHR
jgi:hypothetical protein